MFVAMSETSMAFIQANYYFIDWICIVDSELVTTQAGAPSKTMTPPIIRTALKGPE